MSGRPIVRDRAILSGKWHFQGTFISVQELCRDFGRSGEAARVAYRRLGLADEEIDAALAFAYPEIEIAGVQVSAMSVSIRCVCGMRFRSTVHAPAYETDPCVCGRIWRIPVGIEPGAGDNGSTNLGLGKLDGAL
jgi:uncharacterized protein (DUF433 family)